MPDRHAYIGDIIGGSGRKIGDIVYAPSSPGAKFLLASAAQEVLAASYPALLNTDFFGISDAFGATDALGTNYAQQAVIDATGLVANSARKTTATGAYSIGVASLTAASGWGVSWFNTTMFQNGLCWVTGRNSGNTAWGLWTFTAFNSTLVAANVITFYSGLGDVFVGDILWTGTSWLFAVSGGGVYRCTTSTPLPGSTYTRTYSTGGMSYFLQLGTTIFACDAAGNWIKSTNDGVTWSVATTPTNKPVTPSISYSQGWLRAAYNASLNAVFGMNSSHQVVYNNSDMTAAWTVDGAYPVDSTNRQASKTCFYVDAGGYVWAIAPKSIALRHPASGLWTILDVGVGSGSTTTDQMVQPPFLFNNRLHLKFSGNTATGFRMFKLPSEAGVIPAIASPFQNYAPYLKAA